MQRVILRSSVRNHLLRNVFKGKLHPQITATCNQRIIHLRLSSTDNSSKAVNSLLPSHDDFAIRHIGPRETDQNNMLQFLGFEVHFSVLLLLKYLILLFKATFL